MRLRRISAFWKLACLKASLKMSWSCLALTHTLIKGKMLCKRGNKNSRINTVIPIKKSFFGSWHLQSFNHSFYYNKKNAFIDLERHHFLLLLVNQICLRFVFQGTILEVKSKTTCFTLFSDKI